MSRKDNISALGKVYNSDSNDIVIMYGSRYAGIHSVIFDFFKGKEYYFYDALSLDINIQLDYMAQDIIDTFKIKGFFERDICTAIAELSKLSGKKKVIFINGFTKLLRENKTFINMLVSVLREQCENGRMMIVLATEDINFIDNDFYEQYSSIAHEIRSIIKVEPLTVSEILKGNSFNSFKEFVSFYAVFGGNDRLWFFYSKDVSFRDFVCKEIISHNGRLHAYGEHILPEDLREKTVYNTIMYLLAEGNVKLNDLYEKTGYERAKISVYIKNLIKRGLVKKADSMSLGIDKSVKKGTYYICDEFARFWYKYIFPNITKTKMISSDKFYKKYIDQDFLVYIESSYINICIEHMSKEYPNITFGLYHDKYDAVDFVGMDEEGNIYLAACRFGFPHMSYSKLDNINRYISSEKISPKSVFLISANEFDQKLHLYASIHNDVKLIDFKW